MADNEKLLKISQAARILEVSVDTLRAWDGTGKLDAVRSKGGQRRYSRADVDALLAERTAAA